MTIKTNYFDGATYAAIDDVAPFASLLSDGVYNVVGGSLKVTAHTPNNLSVDVAVGKAIKNGYFISSDAVVNVTINSNVSGNNRIDIIVLNIDATGKITTIITVQGTPNANPTAPLPLPNQLVLAQVYVGNNTSSIITANIDDIRVLPQTATLNTLYLSPSITNSYVASGLIATKNGTNPKQLDVTAGTALMYQPDTGLMILRHLPAQSFLTFYPSTVYYLNLNPDGTLSWDSSASVVTGHLVLYQILTDASGNIGTIPDGAQRYGRTKTSISAYQTAPQTLTTSAFNKVDLPYSSIDDLAEWDPVNSYFIVPRDGIYLIGGYFEVTTAGNIQLSIKVGSGSYNNCGLGVSSGGVTKVNGAITLRLKAGNVVECDLYAYAAATTNAGQTYAYFFINQID